MTQGQLARLLDGVDPDPLPYKPHRPKPRKLTWADKLLHKCRYADAHAVKAEIKRINETTNYYRNGRRTTQQP